jgi:hypothetical protein
MLSGVRWASKPYQCFRKGLGLLVFAGICVGFEYGLCFFGVVPISIVILIIASKFTVDTILIYKTNRNKKKSGI